MASVVNMENMADMTRADLAEKYFKEGYNCAQSVVLAYSDLLNMDTQTLAKSALPFGAGMGRMRLTCGALSGACLVLGLAKGKGEPFAQNKAEMYAIVQDFSNKFKEEFGYLLCGELLSGVSKTNGTMPEPRTNEYYKKRPCVEFVRFCAELLEEYV